MSDIVSLMGNPIKDKMAVHFPASSGFPVYPEKKSNIVINTDGSMEYGSAEETVSKINKNVFFATMKYKESDGTIVNASGRSRTLSYIPTDAVSISVDGTKVLGLEILAWDLSGTYVGTWNGSSWGTNESFFESVEIAKIASLYTTYKFKINAKIDGSSIEQYETADYLLWEYSKVKSESTTLDMIDGVMAFDCSTITVIENANLNGATGLEGYDTNYVVTGFVDISKRIGNVIKFNGTIVANPIGFSIYDKGYHRIDGLWGTSPDLPSSGYVSDLVPQHITWTVPKEAYYLRVPMRKEYYAQKSDFGIEFYVYKQQKEVVRDSNFITIAHKGFGDATYADTLRAFICAAEAGFNAVEIDCRKMADGVYIVSHNATETLYKNGTGQSVTFASADWSDVKGMTIDSAGKYPLCTVAQVFNTLKKYKMDYFVIDLKDGSNEEIMEIARRCGVVNQIMLSYYNYSSFSDDLTMLADFPKVAIRFTPNITNSQFETIRSAIKNQLYADINVFDAGNVYIPNALSWKIPILCSGVTDTTKHIMSPIAAGAMANLTLQYSPEDFINMISLDYSQLPTLTTETESVSLTSGTEVSVVVSSDIDDPACWPFGYSSDLSVFSVNQTGFDDEVTFKLTKVSAGTANFIVFTATGEQIVIPVTVT